MGQVLCVERRCCAYRRTWYKKHQKHIHQEFWFGRCMAKVCQWYELHKKWMPWINSPQERLWQFRDQIVNLSNATIWKPTTNQQQTNKHKQTNNQASKQASKQANKQASKQTNKQANGVFRRQAFDGPSGHEARKARYCWCDEVGG